jgi:hypothetical protein
MTDTLPYTDKGSYVASPGWGSRVLLGPGQDHARRVLLGSIRHPSRAWHEAPTLRSFERSPGTAHRLVHRLAALGVVALQSTLGRDGGIRFTFGVRRWRTHPVRVGLSRRMRPARPAVAQLAAWPDDELEEPEPPPARSRPVAWADRPAPTLVPTPDGRRPSFREELERHGFRVPDAWAKREEAR